MALQKQVLPVVFGQGIDTKIDVKQQILGIMRRAKNVVYETLRSVKKRNGYQLLKLVDASNNRLTSSSKLTRFKNELDIFADAALYSYSDALERVTYKGQLNSIVPKSVPVQVGTYNHAAADVLSVENLNVFVSLNTSLGTADYSVQDNITKGLIVSNVSLGASVTFVRVASIGNYVYVLYSQGSSLYYQRFNVFTPQVIEAQQLLISDLNSTTPIFDAYSTSSKIIVAYNTNAVGDKVAITSILSDGTRGTGTTIASSTAIKALDVFVDSQTRVVVTYATGTSVYFAILRFTLTGFIQTQTLLESQSKVCNITAVETSAGNYGAYYEVSADLDLNHYIRYNTFTATGTIGTAAEFKRGLGLASKAFTLDSLIYVPVVFGSEIQATYFLLDSTGAALSKVSPELGGGIVDYGVLPNCRVLSSTQVLFASLVKTKVASEQGKFFSLLGINSTIFDFAVQFPYQNAVLGDNLHVAGGLLQAYDGDSVVEHGFNMWPEALSAGNGTSAIGGLVAGNRAYKAVYRWTDNYGQEHRSVPSDAFEVNFATSSTPTGRLATTAPITVASTVPGNARNGQILTIQVAAPAANPTNTLLAVVSGTYLNAVLTLTPNDGTHNGAVPVTFTSANLATLIATRAIAGKVVTLTDTAHVLNQLTASGGDTTVLALDGEGDDKSVTLAGGSAIAPSGTWTTTAPITVYSRTVGTSRNTNTVTLVVAAAAANPTNTILVVITGTAAAVTITVTPNSGANNGAVPVNLTTAELSDLITYGAVTGKVITLTDASSLRADLRTEGGGATNLAHSGEGDGKVATLASGAIATSQGISVPSLRLTRKTNVVIELYRTEANGSIYYLCTTSPQPTFNNPAVDVTNVVDTTSDANLISQQVLYTTGGVLENTQAPAASVVAVHTASDRIFLLDLENPQAYAYSKIRQVGQPVEFADELTGNIDPVGGRLTIGASMDEKFIIFAEDAIFYISGTGPTNTGEQDTFTRPERVRTDVGCIEPSSVVLVPDGLMFKSRKGIYLLTRGLETQYIGAAVEEYNSLEVTSAKIVGKYNQVRFTTRTGDCLVYNYDLKLWGTFDNHQAKSAEVVGTDYYYVRTDGALFKETPGIYSDNGSSVQLVLESGWMSFNSLQGFQRAYKMLLLGQYKSAHKLRVQIAYDFNEAWVQEDIIDPTDFIIASVYGADSPYGSGTPYGGDGSVYQARVDFTIQKCQAIKVRISDLQSLPSEGLALSAMSIQVGGKQGLGKVSSNRQSGTQ